MRVIYFHEYFSTPEGAGGTRSYKFAQSLLSHGHEVTMVCGTPDRGKTGLEGPFKRGKRVGIVDGIKVIELHLPSSNRHGFVRRSFTFIRYSFRSVFLLFSEHYDLVFATSTPLTAGIPGIFASLFLRKRFIFEVRDLWPELPKEMGVIKSPILLSTMSALEWLSYHSAKRCVGLSPGIVDGIVRRGIDRHKVIMIPNGCDLDIFSPPKVRGVLRPPGFKESDFIAIFAGAHGIANGLDAVLDAAAELKRQRCDHIKILLVGSGKLKSVLQERAFKEGLDNCHFWDPIPKTSLAELFQRVDVGLMILDNVPAFYYGTSPNKFFDYIAAGLPVLNNYPGWLADMITKWECGVVVPPADPKKFANALMSLASNQLKLESMGRRSRILAEQHFERNNLAKSFVRWIEKHNDSSLRETADKRGSVHGETAQ